MSYTLRWLVGAITHNATWKLLALLIAVAIWAMVANEPELATFATVPLEYKNLPADLEISSSLIESVYLELRGPSGELRGLSDARRPAVVVDMSGIGPGERTFPVGDGSVRLPRGLRLVRAIPSQVRFDFERRAFRSVPVKVRFTGQQGELVASYRVTPSELRILGPESHVAAVLAAETDPVDLSLAPAVSRDGTVVGYRVNAFIEDAYVRFHSSPTVVISVTMKKKQ